MTVFTSIPSSVTLECHSLAEYENLLSNVRKSSSDQRSRKLSAWILRHKLNGRASNERGRQLWEVSFPLRHQHLHRFSDSESYFHLNDIIFESVLEVRALQSNQHLPHLWCLCGSSSQSAGSRALSGSPSAWWQSETHQTDLPAAAHTHTHTQSDDTGIKYTVICRRLTNTPYSSFNQDKSQHRKLDNQMLMNQIFSF